MLWFDVGIVRYTTRLTSYRHRSELWFDVGIVRYTTFGSNWSLMSGLWFDVGIVRYTTPDNIALIGEGCGLM